MGLATPAPVAHRRAVTAAWRSERLPELARALASRPRHEALRGHVTDRLSAVADRYFLQGAKAVPTIKLAGMG